MAVVQFVDPLMPNGRITRGMAAPKKVTSLEHWLKEARKVIREIPSARECIIERCNATPRAISYDLRRPDGTRVYVVIDRTLNGMVLK